MSSDHVAKCGATAVLQNEGLVFRQVYNLADMYTNQETVSNLMSSDHVARCGATAFTSIVAGIGLRGNLAAKRG